MTKVDTYRNGTWLQRCCYRYIKNQLNGFSWRGYEDLLKIFVATGDTLSSREQQVQEETLRIGLKIIGRQMFATASVLAILAGVYFFSNDLAAGEPLALAGLVSFFVFSALVIKGQRELQTLGASLKKPA